MVGKLKLLGTIVRWGYFVVSEIIGFAGVPDDLAAWRTNLKAMAIIQVLDIWFVRWALIISGGLVLTYPQWWPKFCGKITAKKPERSAEEPVVVEEEPAVTESSSVLDSTLIPVRYGRNGLEEGLFVKNVGEKPLLDVSVDPLRLGSWTVSFIGPEITYLEAGDTCFFGIAVEGPPTPLSDGLRLFRVLRGWQNGDWGREATGHIRYKDIGGMNRETWYRIGVDVLNRDGGIVVGVVSGSSGHKKESG